MLCPPHVDENYLLNFSAIFNRIHSISKMPIPLWIRVLITSRTSNSRSCVQYPRWKRRTFNLSPSFYYTISLRIAKSPGSSDRIKFPSTPFRKPRVTGLLIGSLVIKIPVTNARIWKKKFRYQKQHWIKIWRRASYCDPDFSLKRTKQVSGFQTFTSIIGFSLES